ncbi:MAG: hydantoinase B/oxoprolinase family protein [Planctomycetota bacterium]
MKRADETGPDSEFDPVELEIMRSRWRGAAEEACAAMVRSAYSPNIKDRRDCSAALALPDGQVIAQAEVGTPLHLGIMPAILRAVLARFPASGFRPGDAVITNLPYPEGPGHLPDVSMVSGVFHGGRLVALAATTAHHIDLGGYAPGSMPFGVHEIYQEGLQIPPVQIIRGGEFSAELLSLIEQNVRTQHELRGDLLAQFAAGQTAEARVQEMAARDGAERVTRYARHILDHAERCMRAGIAGLPDGTYRFEDLLDDDGVSDQPVKIAAAVTVRGDELSVDFAGSSPQVRGPLNCRLSAARSCVYYAAKAVIDPDLPVCSGAYRPIEVLAEEGSVLHARFPAAIGNANILTDQRVVDVLLGALHQAAPERVCAACSGEMNLINLGGIDHRGADRSIDAHGVNEHGGAGRYFNYVETLAGGQGASHDLDGADAVHTHLTNTLNTPVEVIEQNYPLRVVRYEIIPGSGGPGRQRGGCGLRRELECLVDGVTVSIGADRRRFTPWGVGNDRTARGAFCCCRRAGGVVEPLPTKVLTTLNRGDVLCIETPGGGGWGDPADRDPEATAFDQLEGLVTPPTADATGEPPCDC